ncbi:hypothetical protein JKP88DRAFT_249615 [Tribonema minus]|uniref:Uncharacterized protein n=1 Tax=Tribonema minus TaxID=303371 RepID=A0A835YTC7_9STRA|nr:hypothetical protein JKP88DRAFT_249615 [Tribonema minus]
MNRELQILTTPRLHVLQTVPHDIMACTCSDDAESLTSQSLWLNCLFSRCNDLPCMSHSYRTSDQWRASCVSIVTKHTYKAVIDALKAEIEVISAAIKMLPRMAKVIRLQDDTSHLLERVVAIQLHQKEEQEQEEQEQRQRGGKAVTTPPFQTADVCACISSFCGPGHWLFLASVNKTFKAAYMRYLVNELGINFLFKTSAHAAVQTSTTHSWATEVTNNNSTINANISYRHMDENDAGFAYIKSALGGAWISLTWSTNTSSAVSDSSSGRSVAQYPLAACTSWRRCANAVTDSVGL